MRRSIRNPRFAPECLESRLSPSSLTGTDLASTSAYVDTTTLDTNYASEAPSGKDSTSTPSGDGLPIIVTPAPIGPHVPA